MSEERFNAIEARLDANSATLGRHTARLDEHSEKLDALSTDVAKLKTGQEEIHQHLIRIDGRLDKHLLKLDKIEVTLEHMRDDIKLIAEGHGVTQAAIARSTEEIIAHIDARIAPLEIAVRAHFGAT